MTSTKIKFMVGVEDFEHGDNQWKKSSLEIEAGLKEFFVRCSPVWQLFLVLSVALISYISIVQNFLLIRIQLYLIYLFTIMHPFCYEVWCAWIVRWICIESILRTKKEKDQFTSIQHWCFSSSTVVQWLLNVKYFMKAIICLSFIRFLIFVQNETLWSI